MTLAGHGAAPRRSVRRSAPTRIVSDLPHPVDRHVGRTVAAHRIEQHLSQKDLGDALDLSFQQIQKYEKGINRISASKLWEISQFLGVDLQRLFPSVSAPGALTEAGTDLQVSATTRQTVEIGRLAPTLSLPRQRLVLELMRVLVSTERPARTSSGPAGT